MKNMMFKSALLLAVTALVSCGSKDPETDLKGTYHGKNLFIENPYGPGNVGFCVIEVKVNGKITTDEINSEAFEIDLSSHNFQEGDPVEVELVHKKGCEPVVKNPDALH